jgi:hypothetical protein
MDHKNASQDARNWFKNAGLNYADITRGDILVLFEKINKRLKAGESALENLHMSEKLDIKANRNGTMRECYLYVNSHYFTRRECISFNADGFVGFAGWADIGTAKPIIDAFNDWVDYLVAQQVTTA